MSAARTVLFSFAWLFSVFVVIGLMADGGMLSNPEKIQYPTDFAQDASLATGGVYSQDSWLTRTGTCFKEHILVAFFATAACPIAAFIAPVLSEKVHIPVISEVIQIIRLAMGTVVFLFTMVNYSVTELNAGVNMLIFIPPGLALLVIAVQIARGVSG